MARSVYKYAITQGKGITLMHQGARLVYADGISQAVLEHFASESTPRHIFFVWGEVHPAAQFVNRHIGVFMTGDSIPEGWTHVYSFQVEDTDGAPFIGHVYEGGEF